MSESAVDKQEAIRLARERLFKMNAPKRSSGRIARNSAPEITSIKNNLFPQAVSFVKNHNGMQLKNWSMVLNKVDGTSSKVYADTNFYLSPSIKSAVISGKNVPSNMGGELPDKNMEDLLKKLPVDFEKFQDLANKDNAELEALD